MFSRNIYENAESKQKQTKNLKKNPNKLYKIYVIVVAYYYESQYINHLLRENHTHKHKHWIFNQII